MTKKKTGLKILTAGMLGLALPLSLLGLSQPQNISQASSFSQYTSSVSITNGSFGDISGTYYEGDPSGWQRYYGSTGAKTMIIDTVTNYSTNSSSTYYLKNNPGTYGTEDNKILMINSSSSSPNNANYQAREISEGYISDEITLSANSYYEFSVAVKTASFNDANEFASIYISGLVDENGDEIELSTTNIQAREWQVQYYYIATGAQEQTITIDLWLGSETFASTGVAFFDEVCGRQLSENAYYWTMQKNQESGIACKNVLIEKSNFVDTSSLNFDFEKDLEGSTNNLVDWERTTSAENSHAMILNMNEDNFKNTTDLTYPGTDFSKDNSQALVLWTDDDSYVTVESLPFEIKSMMTYKVTLHVKFADLESGSFYVKLNETETIKNNFEYLKNYELMSATSSAVSTNGSNNFINSYNEVTFYIQGHDRYDSEVTMSLMLGTSDSLAKGGVVVDNITLEQIAYGDFSSEGNVLKLATATDESTTITNGYFNQGEPETKEHNFPVKPAGFEISQSSLPATKEAGIINIYAPYFESYKANGYDWAQSLANPGNPNADSKTDDVNNILMMYNAQLDYQSITSSTFTLTAGSYYNFSIDFKTYGENAKFNIKLIDEDGIVILYEKGLNSSVWTTYNAVINAGETSSTITAVIEFGNEDEKATGYAFFDNMELLTSSSEEFETATVKVDLSGFMLSLDPNNEIGYTLTSSNVYAGSLTSGSIGTAEGGIIKGEGNDSFGYKDHESIDDGSLTKNVLTIITYDKATYTLTSNFKLSLEASKYYVLKFRLLTSLPDEFTYVDDNGDEQQASFGVSVGLSEYNLVTNLKANEGWTSYEIYFEATEAVESDFVFKLVSDRIETSGYAYLTDITWAESDSTTYEGLSEKEGYDETIFKAEATTEETEDDDTTTDDSTSSDPDNSYIWLLIPSLIFGVTIILAVILFALRKFKWSRPEKKAKGDYDREQSLHQDVITNEAKNIRNIEIERVKSHIAELQAQIDELEQENKKIVSKAREEGKVTKEVERKFKSFAQKRTRLQKNVEEFKEHLAYIESADYLMIVEKRILADHKKMEQIQNKKDKKQNEK